MGNEKNIRGRIAKVKEVYKWTENSIAADSATQKRLNRQLSHGATITLETLLIILKASPGLSADWLLLGDGEMFRSHYEAPASDASCGADNHSHLSHSDADITRRFLSLLEEKDVQIDRLIDLLSK